MEDPVERLVCRKDVKLGPPSNPEDIEAVAARFSATLPEDLIRLWELADGFELPTLWAEFLGPTEVLEITRENGPVGWWCEFGWLPLLDTRQSNYVMCLVRPPLAYRFLWCPHDDDCAIRFRTLQSFLESLLGALDDPEKHKDADSHFHSSMGDYAPDARRPLEDQDAARALLKVDGEEKQWHRAIDLLDESNLVEWARLLETDHFIRRDVRDRMRKMTSPAIRRLYEQDSAAFREFTALFASTLRGGGHEVVVKDDGIRVDGTGINVDYFFYRRSAHNAMQRLVQWFDDDRNGKDPRDRPGHYFDAGVT